MISKKRLIILICSCVFAFAVSAQGRLSEEQKYSLFAQAGEAFKEGYSAINDPARADKLFEKAILNYEKIINDGRVLNSRLYYNLGNVYFLKGDIGRAILNYRRAQGLDNSDRNIAKNLDFARERRLDTFGVRTRERVLQTLFFWHYDFSIKTKFTLGCVFFAIVCISLCVHVWFGRNALSTVTAVICGILLVCFFTSVAVESQSRSMLVSGVITVDEVIARQGDGQNYPPAFKDSLHSGTEFDLLEHRPGWLHIELSDDSDAWVPETAADLI